MRWISAAHPQVSGVGLGEVMSGLEMASNSEAATPSSTQKATSHLSRRGVPFILRGRAFFRCVGLGCVSIDVGLRHVVGESAMTLSRCHSLAPLQPRWQLPVVTGRCNGRPEVAPYSADRYSLPSTARALAAAIAA